MTKMLKYQDFQPFLDQAFEIEEKPDTWINALLTEVSELNFKYPHGSEAERTPFALVFRAGKEIHLIQRIYNIKHAELGELEIFLVPIQPDQEGTLYEAVFT